MTSIPDLTPGMTDFEIQQYIQSMVLDYPHLSLYEINTIINSILQQHNFWVTISILDMEITFYV